MCTAICVLGLILLFLSGSCRSAEGLFVTARRRPECPLGSGTGETGSCEICPPGSISEHDYCNPCEAGSFQSDAGHTACTPCPPGTFSLGGATSCTPCPQGQALLSDGNCGVCPPGKHYVEYDPFCINCDAGFFKAEAGLGPCLPCEGNFYSANGAASCTECPEKQALFEDGSCSTCPPGQYYEKHLLFCSECHPGTFTDCPNVMTDCFYCGGNSFSTRGATEYIECPRGTVYIASSMSCESCPAGTVYHTHSGECKECEYNHFSRGLGENYCQSCAKNSYARRGAATCFACPFGTVFIAEIDECGNCDERETYSMYGATCGGSPVLPVFQARR
ncbi:protein kinase [Gracilaria domingensis]|nr:protein kinase [Gracilaria domingensis]